MSVGWQVPQEAHSSGKGKRTALVVAIVVIVVAVGGYMALAARGADSSSGDALGSGLLADGSAGESTGLATPAPSDPVLQPTPDGSLAPATDTLAGDQSEAPADDAQDDPAPLVFDPYDATSVAVALSRKVFPDGGAENIVLARDTPTGDALAAGALIGLFDTTLLLTDSQRLSPITADEIDRLGNPRVHILGGPDAVSSEIEAQLADAGHDVHRHAGYLQAQTAVDIAGAHFTDARTAVLVRTPSREAGTVEAVSSALTATALAASQDLPVLLTDGETLSQATDAYLQGAVIDRVIVVSDEDQMSSSVTSRLRELGIDWTSWEGSDRFDTAVEVARGRGFQELDDAEVVILVEGGHDAVWPAGFLGTVLASRSNGPVLLTDGTEVPDATRRYLATGSEDDVVVVCTPGVTKTACDEARSARAPGSSAS